jgi:spermidine/putrescine transport system substrate-binding protein
MVNRGSLNRRIADLGFGLAILGLAAVSTFAETSAAELHVLNWKGWGTDEPWALAEFEKRTGAKVVHDFISSYPEVFTKLRTNPGYYDVVILNAAFVGQAVGEKLIQPLDKTALKNYSDLFPDMRDSPQLVIDGKPYGAAWMWGVTSVTYDTNIFKAAPDSLSVLWDPKYANRVCWRDDPEDSVRFTALALGQNPDKPQDLHAVGEKLKALKPQVKAFWKSEDEWRKLVAAKECDLSIFWTSSAEKAVLDKVPVSYFLPKEGAIAFRDALVMPTGAPNTANTKATESIPGTSLTRTILATPDGIKRINFKGPLSDEQRQAYLDLWQETKAFFAK